MGVSIRSIIVLLGASLLAACSGEEATTNDTDAPAQQDVGELNIYSARHYDTDQELYDGFAEQTGIKVNLIEAQSDQLIERIANEGELSPADVLLTVDAGRLWRADQAGIFQAYKSDELEAKIPAYLRHPDGLWYGMSKRARVIVYNKEAGRPEGLNDYTDLADPTYQGQVCIRSSKNIYNISLMASLVSHLGEEAAEEWAKGVVANFARAPQGNDTAQIKSVASGECGLALVNSYYVARLIGSDNAENNAIADAVGVIFPGQDSYGTHVNISGVGIAAHSPNVENAKLFVNYLMSDDSQRLIAEGNNEYPVVADVETTAAAKQLGEFKEDTLNTNELGINQATAVMVFDRAGWQ